MGFKENLRYYRKCRHETQESLAEKLGVVRATVTLWESGVNEPKMGTVTKIAKALGVSITELLFDGDPSEIVSNDQAESILIARFRELNEDGRFKLLDLAEDFICSGRYRD